MNSRFTDYIQSLEPSFQRLLCMEPKQVCALPAKMPEAGIYLFSEGSKHLYVGRTNRLRKRLKEHCQLNHNTAPFGFRLARETTGRMEASYTSKGSRQQLQKEANFNAAFIRANERIKAMDVRYVEERDPMRQYLLEIYVSVALETPYNDFNNH